MLGKIIKIILLLLVVSCDTTTEYFNPCWKQKPGETRCGCSTKTNRDACEKDKCCDWRPNRVPKCDCDRSS